MKHSKSTKRALTASIISLLVCVTMLLGTTFAWFTDTATAGVNKIESGTLDIELQDENGAPLTEALKWVKATDAPSDEAVLWEPGASYDLQPFKVVNKGNLAVKYKIEIAGIASGDAELLDVMDFTFSEANSEPVVMGEDRILKKDTETGLITITAKMREDAGNPYQGKTVDGIAIKVVATQAPVEYDSTTNTYDENAAYPVAVTGKVNTEGETVLTDNKENPEDATVTVTAPQNTIDEATTSLTLTVEESAAPGNITLSTENSAVSKEIKLVDQAGQAVSATTGNFFTVKVKYAADLTVVDFYHYDTKLTKVASADEITANDQYYYDAKTGILTFSTDDFSPFTLVCYKTGSGTEEDPYLIATGEQAYGMRNGSGYYKLVEDVVVTNEIYLSGKTYVLDLNGHSLKLEYADDVKPNNGGVLNVSGKKGKLTVKDSSAEQTGKVIGSDKTYANKVTSAVRVGNYGTLDIYGGHFYGTSDGTSCIFVMTSRTSGSKATVNIYGGTFETATPNTDGTYYVLNHQDSATTGCTITVHGGSFKNYNPGVTEVDPVNAYTGKISLATGCTTTTTTEGDNTWYTVSK